jgi:hypothetical protein
MINMIKHCFFVIFVLTLTNNLYANENIKTICSAAMNEVFSLAETQTTKESIVHQLNKKYKNEKLQNYLVNTWIDEALNNKTINRNTIFKKGGKQLMECVQTVGD